MRIIGIDFGERRIGVAAADDRLRMALPVETVTVDADPVDEIVRIAKEQGAGALVLGLPLSLTGAEGPQAQVVREAAERLGERLAIPIYLHDERLTTAQATRSTAGGRGGRPPRPARLKSGPKSNMHGGGDNRDAVAASILLQAYLDSQRPYD
jgi:putative Holliday junction resolvase